MYIVCINSIFYIENVNGICNTILKNVRKRIIMNIKPLVKKYKKYTLSKNFQFIFVNNFEYYLRVEVISNAIQNLYETGDLSFN